MNAGPSRPTSRTSPDAKLNYAWGWFQYHASQRLTAFNFFLVLIGLLFVTFAQAVNHGWAGVGVAIGILGTVVSTGFWMLDIRNEELIICGVRALEALEDKAGLRIVPRGDEREHLAGALGNSPCGTGWLSRWTTGDRGCRLYKHRMWLRLVMALVGFTFLAGTIWAGTGFSGAAEAGSSRKDRRETRIQVEVGGVVINSTR